MDDFGQIVTILALAASLLAVIFRIIIPVRKLVKNKDFFRILLDWIGEAEKSGKSGDEKRELVLARLGLYCNENNINFDSADYSQLISLIVSFVNVIKAFTAQGKTA